jgi:hypothetical protein
MFSRRVCNCPEGRQRSPKDALNRSIDVWIDVWIDVLKKTITTHPLRDFVTVHLTYDRPRFSFARSQMLATVEYYANAFC